MPTHSAAAPETGWLRANAGGFAIALSIVVGACVWGFVSSPAFATLMLYLLAASVTWLIACVFAREAGWLGALAASAIGLFGLYLLACGIREAIAMLHAAG